MVFISQNLNFRLYVGRNIPFTKTLNETLMSHLSAHFDFLLTPLFDNENMSLLNSDLLNNSQFKLNAHTDTTLEGNNWRYIVAEISNGIVDDENEKERLKLKKNLKREINYAIYLGVYAVLIPFPSKNHSNYAREINKLMEKALPNTEIWMRVPLKQENCWEIYNSFRMNLTKTNGFGVFLEFSEDLPDSMNRWFGETIKAVALPTEIFVSNEKNLPILIKAHQDLVIKLFYFKTNFIIMGKNDENLNKYRNFLCQIFDNQPKMSEMQMMEANYFDQVQIPLQPTKDNLEMFTYMTFEKDKKKYEIYAKAINQVLTKKYKTEQKIFIIMIGPGRGPIMREIITACIENGYENFNLLAVEKNPNSIYTLQNYINKNDEYLKGRVKVICEDIRKYSCEEKADILVSELIGSFGDNELSPELICSVERLLKKDGFCLPYQYTSYLAPITCAHAYNKVSSFTDMKNPFEITHLIAFQRCNLPSKIQGCFRFEHPFKEQSNFKRFKVLEYEFKEQNIIHGLAGYFDCFLFEEVFFSICPLNKTENMYSWFPIFFPFEQILIVDENKILKINFWRLASKKRVWYEWQPELFCKETKKLLIQLKIHNANGKFHSIEK